MPDGGMSTPRSSGGVTLISPGVSRGPRLMIGVNFRVVISRLPCPPPRVACRRGPSAGSGSGGSVSCSSNAASFDSTGPSTSRLDHLPRRRHRCRQTQLVRGVLVGQSVAHALRIDVVQALAVPRVGGLQPDVLSAIDVTPLSRRRSDRCRCSSPRRRSAGGGRVITEVFGDWSPGSRCHAQHSVGASSRSRTSSGVSGSGEVNTCSAIFATIAGLHRRWRDQPVGVGRAQRRRGGVVDLRHAVGQHHVLLLAGVGDRLEDRCRSPGSPAAQRYSGPAGGNLRAAATVPRSAARCTGPPRSASTSR